jgi:hypothetical protein
MTDDETCAALGMLLSDGNPSSDELAGLVERGLAEPVASLGGDLGEAERITAGDVTLTDEGRRFYAERCRPPS